MGKIGLFLQLISFLMFFWDAELRPLRPPEKGGLFCTTAFEKQEQFEEAFSFIPWIILRKFLSRNFHWISAGLFATGTAFQFIDC